MRCSAFGLTLGLLVLAPPSSSAEEPPAIVALTLDTSGSIRPELIEQTRALAVSILEALPEGSEVALFTFDDSSRLILTRTSDPEAVRQALQGVKRAGRFTALYDALYDASRYLENSPRSRKAMVLVTDGMDEKSTLQQEDGLKVATTGRIPIFAVGVGRIQEAVLARIAKLTGGEFTPMSEASGEAIAARIAALEPTGALPRPSPRPPVPRPSAPSRAASGLPEKLLLFIGAWVVVVGAAAVVLALRLGSRARTAPGRALGTTGGSSDESALRMAARIDSAPDPVEATMVLRTEATLRVMTGLAAGRVLPLGPGRTVTIGRASNNDLELSDPSVSAEHCRVSAEGESYIVDDVRSTNGTLVNGQPADRKPLRNGDTITIGAVRIKFMRA